MRLPTLHLVSLSALVLLGSCGDDEAVSPDSGTGDATRQDVPRSDTGPPDLDDHGYFDWLTEQDEIHHSTPLRSQEEIDAHLHGRVEDPREAIYDPAEDALRMQVSSGAGSIDQQVRVPFEQVSTGNLLFYWEGRWGPGFVADGDIDGLETQKAYQLARDGAGDDRRIEPRTRFVLADAPFVAAADTRTYHFTPAVGENQPLEPQVGAFSIRPETWTRFWAYVDFDNDQYTYWIADEETAPVLIHDAVGLDYSTFPMGSAGLDSFWFEHNSSQTRTDGTPVLHIWGRNLAVLRDVADPAALVAEYTPS